MPWRGERQPPARVRWAAVLGAVDAPSCDCVSIYTQRRKRSTTDFFGGTSAGTLTGRAT
ncbi:MAG TPA: hypothetical protein VFT41_12575 [Gemmatimonadaceae bacterium]|nr:hypothetical protein [Gemmatimonadaceae bacterium]